MAEARVRERKSKPAAPAGEPDFDWREIAYRVQVSRELDRVEEEELVPQRKILYQFSARGHDMAQVMLGTKLTQGAVITQVRDNSPADTAGIKAGDIVVALNGRPVNNENDLYNAEGLLPINSNVELKLVREGRTLTLSVPLAAEQLSSTEGAKVDPRIAGAELSDASERVRRQGLNGVSVTRVAAGSRAAQNGLKQGDLIVAVGQVQIAGLADLTSLTAKHPRQLELAVVRNKALEFLSMQ